MTEEYLESIRQRLYRDPEIPEGADIEVLAATPILWCGWECDTVAVIYRILPDGEQRLHVLDEVHVPSDRLLETLDERIVVYEKAVSDTKAFIERAKGLAPPREWRWLCTACQTEGRGNEPAACPACRATNAWYNYRTTVDDTQPAIERLYKLLAPKTTVARALSILDQTPNVPPDPGDEML